MGNYNEIYVHRDINVYIYNIFYNRTQKATQYTEDILSFKPVFIYHNSGLCFEIYKSFISQLASKFEIEKQRNLYDKMDISNFDHSPFLSQLN